MMDFSAWHGTGRVLRELWLDALALVWPTECVSCGAPDRDCCDACVAEIRAARGAVVWASAPAGVTVCAAGPYAGPLRALLVALKHSGHTGFARELGPRLLAPLRAASNRSHGSLPPLLVTVPSRAARVRERGYRHVDLLVRAALREYRRTLPRERHAQTVPVAQRLGAPLPREPLPVFQPRVLRALRGRTSQVGLSAQQRQQNAALVSVRRAARRSLIGREVVLVDDVVTTGATVRAAAEALQACGARVVAIVALCAVERRSARRGSQRDTDLRTDAHAISPTSGA